MGADPLHGRFATTSKDALDDERIQTGSDHANCLTFRRTANPFLRIDTMATYRELQSQIEKLQTQAEAARQKEVADVVAQIHELARQYQLTPQDLGLNVAGTRRRKTTGAAAKYRDPQSGATWSGRGRAPRWLAGQDKAKFEIR